MTKMKRSLVMLHRPWLMYAWRTKHRWDKISKNLQRTLLISNSRQDLSEYLLCWLCASHSSSFISFSFQNLRKQFREAAELAQRIRQSEVGPAVNQLAFSGTYVLHQSLFTRGWVSFCHWAILGQVTLCSRTIVSRNWEIQKSEMVRDWGRREDAVPSAT